VIVDAAVHDAFAERLARVAASWTVGDPLEAGVQMGPLVNQAALGTVLGYLDTGTRDGGTYLAGGERAADLGDGYFVRPTVVTGLPAGSAVLEEEIFGPVAALVAADGYDEALALANDSPYGLAASLFTRDLAQAMRFADDVEAGIVKVNQESSGVEHHVPFGGVKSSSSGSREQGRAAREFFTSWKTVYIET
jgi:aldehyde dehydrogenase (NAD+)